MKTIQVDNPTGLPTIEWEYLKANFEPNALKDKKSRNIGDLKQSIINDGFDFPLFIWLDGKYIVDGTGRFMALEMLEYEGYKIPAIPYWPIKAKDKKEAKYKTLKASSAYGEVTKDTISEFIIDLDEYDLGLVSLPNLDIDEIDIFSKERKENKNKRTRGESHITHTCPNCGTEFSSTDEE